MQMLYFLIIIIPIIIIGELHINNKVKKVFLMLLSFLYNTFLGLATFIAMFIIAFSTAFFDAFSLIMIIIGILFLIFLLTINIYIYKKTNVNIILYLILNVVCFFIGLGFLWKG